MTPEEIKKLQDDLAAKEESLKKLEDKNREILEEKRKIKEAEDLAKKEANDLKEKLAKDAGDYKTLAENYKKDKEALEQSIKDKEQMVVNSLKTSNLSTELDKLGVNPSRKASVMKLANIEEIRFDESTKTVYGADIVAKKLQTEMPELFGAGKNAPPADDVDPNKVKKYSPEWYHSLSKDEQKKVYKEYMEANGIKIR